MENVKSEMNTTFEEQAVTHISLPHLNDLRDEIKDETEKFENRHKFSIWVRRVLVIAICASPFVGWYDAHTIDAGFFATVWNIIKFLILAGIGAGAIIFLLKPAFTAIRNSAAEISQSLKEKESKACLCELSFIDQHTLAESPKETAEI